MIKLDLLAFLRNLNSSFKKAIIEIPAETQYIRKVSSRILSSLDRYDLDEGVVFDIKLCIECMIES